MTDDPIAIVGMGCRVPGAATVEALWNLLCDGIDATAPLPRDRWDPALHGGDAQTPGTIYSQRGGFLDAVDTFDAAFFGISPAEAERLDPQQRMLLEVTWHALEDAQLPPGRLRSARCGVYVGLSTTDYKNLQVADPTQIDGYTSIGNVFALASGRLSHALGLNGPSLAVDAACASSLVTVHLAVQALRSGECEMAVAGGVHLMIGTELTLSLSRTGALSPEGRCKTFDADADGYARGEGCGMVVLKRLSDALSDGDRVVAVLHGSAVNHDGADSGLTVPNGRAHEDVMRQALADANLSPDRVDYLEAHGTGTPVGDPIELQAVGAVFGTDRPVGRPLLVGSVKTNVGHLEAAAGVVGLIKAALAIQHGVVPPHLNLHDPNPAIPWHELPVEVATSIRRWPDAIADATEQSRVAGVSSFGIGGTNAHVVLGGAPPVNADQGNTPALPTILPLSAGDRAALEELAGGYAELVRSSDDRAVAELAASAACGRQQLRQRAAIVVEDHGQLLDRLEGLAAGRPGADVATGIAASPPPSVAFAFCGQGSQYAGMGQALTESEPVYAEALDYCAELVGDRLGEPLADVLAGTGTDPDAIHRTDWTQVGLFAMQYALGRLWQSWGIRPAAVLGHSAGELAAACAAGAVTVEDAMRLVIARGRLMHALPPGGRMVAVLADTDRVTAMLHAHPEVSVAAINSAEEMVLSGPSEAMTAAVEALFALGIETRDLAVPLAGHSALMDPILDELEAAAAEVRYQSPTATIVSTVTGGVLDEGALDARYWRNNLRQPVLFQQAASALLAEHDVVIDIGPVPVLGRLAGRAGLLGDQQRWVSSLQRDQDPRTTLLSALGQVYAAGVEVDWDRVTRRPTRSVALPLYPFQRRRYWRDTTSTPTAPQTGHPLLGRRLASPALASEVFEVECSADALPEHLADHLLYDVPVGSGGYQLAAVLAALRESSCGDATTASSHTTAIRHDAVMATSGRANVTHDPAIPESDASEVGAQGAEVLHLDQIAFIEPLLLGTARDPVTIQVIVDPPDATGGRNLRLVSRTPNEEWITHLTGTGRVGGADRPNAASTSAGYTTTTASAATDTASKAGRAAEAVRVDRALKADGFTFGPAYRWLAGLDATPGLVTAQLRRPDGIRPVQAPPPGLLEGWLRVLLAAAPEASTGSDANRNEQAAWLPVEIDRLSWYAGELSTDLAQTQAHARLIANDVDPLASASHTDSAATTCDGATADDAERARHAPGTSTAELVGELHLSDQWGRALADATGVRGRKVRRRTLSWAADEPPRHEVVWRAVAAPTSTKTTSTAGTTVTEAAGTTKARLATTETDMPSAAPAEPAATGDWVVIASTQAAPIVDELSARLAAAGGRCHHVHADSQAMADLSALTTSTRLRGIVQLSALTGLGASNELGAQAQPNHARAQQTDDAEADTPLWGQRDELGAAAALVRVAVAADVERLLFATVGAVQTRPTERPDPAHATLHGLPRVVRIEHPDLDCAVVDLEPAQAPTAQTPVADPRAAARALYAALLGSVEPRLAVRGDQWFAPRIASARQQPRSQLHTCPVRSDAAYVVTGGTGALGQHVVSWLAERGASRIYLLGRHQPADPPAAPSGTQVRWRSCDVTDSAAVHQTLTKIVEEGRPVRGIVHAAGVLADATLERADDERLVRPLLPKLGGAWNLHRAHRELGLRLDFLVYFSSVAGVLGNAGQAGYAAANASLDALAAHQRSLGIPAVSIAWGPWEGTGMVARLDERERQRVLDLGLSPLAPEDMAVLDHACQGPPLQVVVRADWSRLANLVAGDDVGLLSELVTGSSDSGLSNALHGGHRDRHPRPTGAGDYVAPRDRTERVLAEVWEDLFRIAPIGIHDNFFAFGGDSILALRVVAAARAVGLRLSGADILAYPTIAEIATTAVPTEVLEAATDTDSGSSTPAADTGTPAAPIGTATDASVGHAPYELRAEHFPDVGLDDTDLALLAEQLSTEPQDPQATTKASDPPPTATKPTALTDPDDDTASDQRDDATTSPPRTDTHTQEETSAW